ncbi:helix-turn-helix domain-containing protein [Candidatus Neptunochlamydia vexilliferae]|uniref:HTH cro/C1-type domain-containing protein n=1 Tax=Candidatus Neptunichlamydia vexilliferae TaxID=1651774 RepID=A0ABS0AYV1_9BACT|nr:helix-turn-helix transcriptional regulator [Candidatus Neptunochlamydia vexilliferae]MBF5058792.1 hypothetical protein [Candidatus Neptunochlamydia vexilliferae]
MKKSEKLFVERVVAAAQKLQIEQKGVEIGPLIALIRKQLKMSQRVLAKRAKVPQSTVSKIESGRLKPNAGTLEKILSAMESDLLITIVPKESLEMILKKQAIVKVKQKMAYLKGTMNLEKQKPDEALFRELFDEEVRKILELPGRELWEEEL